jgi:putative Mg2+ transporter-C (MgtC) family protein
MSPDLPTLHGDLIALSRILGAMALGAAIGFERESADRPAGLRTHMLVAGAAALLTSLGLGLVDTYSEALGSAALRADPLRVIEAIVTAVAFLGAGTIIRSGPQDVRGLTTAASLLLTAGVGISVALARWALAGGIVLLGLLTLIAVRRLETALGRKRRRGVTGPNE